MGGKEGLEQKHKEIPLPLEYYTKGKKKDKLCCVCAPLSPRLGRDPWLNTPQVQQSANFLIASPFLPSLSFHPCSVG